MENIPLLNETWNNFSESFKGLIPLFEVLLDIFVVWWWLIIPFILIPQVKYQWLFWKAVSLDKKNIILEVRIPKEVEKPMRAMENVIIGFWPLYGPPNWFDKWWKGKSQVSFSLELVSIDGDPRFLIRCPKEEKHLFESNIYAEYPEAEIFEVEDYTTKVPSDIPNDRWDLWGTDYTMPNDVYPVKTYRDFEPTESVMEEKRIDPISSLVEGFSRLEEGEQIWVLIKAKPVTDDETGFVKKADKEIEKIAGRKPKPKSLTVFEDILNTLTGFPPKEEVKEDTSMPEMKLTSGEKEKIKAIEQKKSKHLYECFIRCAYIAKKEKFSGGRVKTPIGYMNQFNKYGKIVPWKPTITKITRNWYDWFWFVDKRLYTRKRRIFRNYLRRLSAFFPEGKKGETFVLSSEELASIYHFPSRHSSPSSSLSRVDAKKKEPPANLPTE